MTTSGHTGTDSSGRAYAKVSDIVEGHILEADEDFTCMSSGSRMVVEQDDKGLFVPCSDGKHYLSGQITNGPDGYYMGLYSPKPAVV